MGRESITARMEVKLFLWNRLGLLKPMALLLLMLVAGSPGALGTMEEKGTEDSPVWCVCYQLLNTSEYLPCRLEKTDCLGSQDLWKTPAERGKNCTHGAKVQDLQTIIASLKNIPVCAGDNNTIISPVVKGSFSFFLVITIVTSSTSTLILILLCVGIMSKILKKWRNKRIFKKQKRWNDFLFKSKAVDYQPDAIYSNVINLAAQKEDDFVIYANIPRFQCPRKTSPVVIYAPDQMEHASTVCL